MDQWNQWGRSSIGSIFYRSMEPMDLALFQWHCVIFGIKASKASVTAGCGAHSDHSVMGWLTNRYQPMSPSSVQVGTSIYSISIHKSSHEIEITNQANHEAPLQGNIFWEKHLEHSPIALAFIAWLFSS